MLYKDLFLFHFFQFLSQFNFRLVFFDVLAEPEEFVSSVKHHLLLFPGGRGRDVRPGRDLFPLAWAGSSKEWGGVGGTGLHNNNPLPTSLTHTAIPLQLYCIMWPREPPHVQLKSPFIYTRQGGSWIRNRGRGLAGLYWELNLPALVQRLWFCIRGRRGGWGGHEAKCMMGNSVCGATKHKATKLPPERNIRKNKGGAAKGSD